MGFKMKLGIENTDQFLLNRRSVARKLAIQLLHCFKELTNIFTLFDHCILKYIHRA